MPAMPSSSVQLRDFIVASRYARDGANGLETWQDATARVAAMHKRRWPELSGDIDQAFASVARGFVAPSMRSMQFGGLAAEVNNARMYNCAASPCDRTDFFAEYFWLLLCGAGCGFSVERRFVEKLPRLRDKVEYAAKQMGYRYEIADSIEGWADAVKALFESYTRPRAPYVSFWYGNIRPKGSPIVTGGGLAPGPEPLREALEAVEDMLRRRLGQTLRPIDCYDICMKLSRAVLSGGIRRSASICLFDIDDDAMMQAKTGDWYKTTPWRAYSNNSAVVPATAKRSQFAGILKASREYGDPGFFFQQSPTHLTNPCCEIALEPFIDGVSGWQCCNLSAVAGTYLTKETFPQAVETAAFIGTLQAAYTDFAYLGPVSEAITRRDALLGVSISGFMDQPSWLFDPAVLRNGAAHAIAANQLWVKRLDIASASRVTTTKPAGTESLVFGSASGIHARPGRRYLRRVQCAADDAVAQAYAAANPLAVERSVYNANTIVLTFPIEAPAHSIVADDVRAPEFLQRVLAVQRNWVDPGTVRGSLRHAVSNTCIVRDDEWDIVSDMLWKNRTELAAVSLLAYDGASRHAQAPQEVCRTPEQHEWWEELRQAQRPVDYHGATANAVTAEPACAGGHCEL